MDLKGSLGITQSPEQVTECHFRIDRTYEYILLKLTPPAVYFVFAVLLVNKRMLTFCLHLFGFLFYFVVYLATLSISSPGLLNLLRGAVNCYKIWSSRGQHEIQYTQ
jgi:hypothetical protein